MNIISTESGFLIEDTIDGKPLTGNVMVFNSGVIEGHLTLGEDLPIMLGRDYNGRYYIFAYWNNGDTLPQKLDSIMSDILEGIGYDQSSQVVIPPKNANKYAE